MAKFLLRDHTRLIDIGSKISLELFNDKDLNKVDNFTGYSYLKNIIEILDSISVNISIGITGIPTKTLNRVVLEFFFGATYLFTDKNTYTQKCKDIAFLSIIEEQKGFEPLYKENIGKTEKKLKEQYKFDKEIKLSELDYTKNKNHYDKLLNHSDFDIVKIEYERTKNKDFFKKKNIVPWYSLWDGPNTIETLSHRTNTWNIYDSIYRDLSLYLHGHRIIESNKIHKNKDGSLFTYSIRTPYELDFVTTPSIYICNYLFNKIIDNYLFNKIEMKNELNKILVNYFKLKPKREPFNPISNSFIPFPSPL